MKVEKRVSILQRPVLHISTKRISTIMLEYALQWCIETKTEIVKEESIIPGMTGDDNNFYRIIILWSVIRKCYIIKIRALISGKGKYNRLSEQWHSEFLLSTPTYWSRLLPADFVKWRITLRLQPKFDVNLLNTLPDVLCKLIDRFKTFYDVTACRNNISQSRIK